MFIQYDINIFSLIILLIVMFSSKKTGNAQNERHRFFNAMVFCAILLLCYETAVVILEGRQGTFVNLALHLCYVFIYLASSFFCFMWLLFCLLRQGRRLKNRGYAMFSVPFFICALLLAYNFSTPYLFYITSENIFVANTLLFLIGSVPGSYIVLAAIVVWRNKKSVPKTEFYIQLILPVLISLICVTQHIFLKDVRIVWPSAVIGLLVIQIYAFGEKMKIDHLTGLYNRKCLDDYVQDLVKSAKIDCFAALMLDIDGFKKINDTYGHTEGDRVIVAAAALLKKSVRKGDFVSRYGGDEFLIVLDQCGSKTTEHVINRLRSNVAHYNAKSNLAYKLDFSIGYHLFTDVCMLTVKDIFTKIDGLMYQNKRSKILNEQNVISVNT